MQFTINNVNMQDGGAWLTFYKVYLKDKHKIICTQYLIAIT